MVEARLNSDVKIVWGLMGSAVLFIAAMVLPGLMTGYRPSDERNWVTSLKTLIEAQEKFRYRDADADGIHQYWRADIAGLYAVHPGNDAAKDPIKLIELSVASADDRPRTDIERYAVRSAKAGYRYRAIRHEDENVPAPDRYAAICFPEHYPNPSRYTFIVDERRDIYRMDLGHGRGLEVFPTPAELKTKWSKLD
jgi:hypothetical protein